MRACLVRVETRLLLGSKERHAQARTDAPESIIHSLPRSWVLRLCVRSRSRSRPRRRKPLAVGTYWHRSDDTPLRQFEAYPGKYNLQPSQTHLETRWAVYLPTM